MPTIQARDSSSHVNLGLILAISIGAFIGIVALIAVVLPVLRRRRAARNRPRPSTLEQFMGKAEREQVSGKMYPTHHRSESTGPLLQRPQAIREQVYQPTYSGPREDESRGPLLWDASNWTSGERGVLAQPDNPGYRRADEEDYETASHIETSLFPYPGALPDNRIDNPEAFKAQTAPYTRSPPPGLKLSIPSSEPTPASTHKPSTSPQTGSSDSEYSEYSASTRMHTIDLASPSAVPPVPALPLNVRPRSSLPPEAAPLARGDTTAVAALLKSRAKRAGPQRSVTRTSRIERADSIHEAPSPESDAERPSPRRRSRSPQPPMPMASLSLGSDISFVDTPPLDAETLAYYNSQTLDAARSPSETSDYSDHTIMNRPSK